MTVTAVRKDPHTLTMTLDAEFDASPERVWTVTGERTFPVHWATGERHPSPLGARELKRLRSASRVDGSLAHRLQGPARRRRVTDSDRSGLPHALPVLRRAQISQRAIRASAHDR